MNEATLARIEKFREKMIKTYGTAVTRQDKEIPGYEVLSSGIIGMDYASGIGGLVRGRLHMYWGPEGVGKTTAAICAMAEAQKKYPDLIVGYIDMEQTFDWSWATHFGLQTGTDRFFHVYPNDSEDVSDQLKEMCNEGVFSMIVVDSIGGMQSRAAFEKKAAESAMGRNAQVITRMCQNVTVEARRNKVYILFINQVRAAIGGSVSFDTYSGPKNLRHQLTLAVKFSRTGTPPIAVTKDKVKLEVAKELRVKIDKCKVAAEGRVGTFVLHNRPSKHGPMGINRVDDAITVGELSKVIERNGAQFVLPDGTKHTGREAMAAYLKEHEEVMALIREKAVETVKAEVLPDGLDVGVEFLEVFEEEDAD